MKNRNVNEDNILQRKFQSTNFVEQISMDTTIFKHQFYS